MLLASVSVAAAQTPSAFDGCPPSAQVAARFDDFSKTGKMPPDLGRWLNELAERLRGLGQGDLRRQAAAAWRATVQPLCQALEGRYPVDAAARAQVDPVLFSRLLAPARSLNGGLAHTKNAGGLES